VLSNCCNVISVLRKETVNKFKWHKENGQMEKGSIFSNGEKTTNVAPEGERNTLHIVATSLLALR